MSSLLVSINMKSIKCMSIFSAGHTGRGFLADVPIVSWVCVGLGIIVSTVVFMKPVWWNK